MALELERQLDSRKIAHESIDALLRVAKEIPTYENSPALARKVQRARELKDLMKTLLVSIERDIENLADR